MEYLNRACLAAVSGQEFEGRQPYPWVGITESLTTEAFELLCQTLPEISAFERQVGVKRAHGQAPHDRYLLRSLCLTAGIATLRSGIAAFPKKRLVVS